MSKKSVNRKEIVARVKEAEQEGMTRQEIFDELKELYYDEKGLAKHIAYTVNNKRKEKYGYLNTILICCLGLSGVSKMLAATLLLSDESGLFALILPLVGLVDILLIISLSRYEGSIYTIVMIFALLGFTRSLEHMGDVNSILALLLFLFPLAVMIIAYYTKSKLFPNLTFNGGVEKKPNGDFELGD